VGSTLDFDVFMDKLVTCSLETPVPSFLSRVVMLSVDGGESLAMLACKRNGPTLDMLRMMYREWAPFRYSVDNKESSLLIRDKSVVDLYVEELIDHHCNENRSSSSSSSSSSISVCSMCAQRELLKETENEARLSEHWVLKITEQDHLESKTLTQNFRAAELRLLHYIQAKWLREYRELSRSSAAAEKGSFVRKNQQQLCRVLDNFIQMSILAISEALGFAG